MYEVFVYKYVYVPHAFSALRGHKRASYPLELELKLVVSCHISAEKQAGVCWKNSQSSEPQSHLSER